MSNRIESTECSRATTVVYTGDYPITLHLYGWNRPNIKAQCSLFTYKWVWKHTRTHTHTHAHTHAHTHTHTYSHTRLNVFKTRHFIVQETRYWSPFKIRLFLDNISEHVNTILITMTVTLYFCTRIWYVTNSFRKVIL